MLKSSSALARFSKHKKWNTLFDVISLEFWASVIISIIVVLVFNRLSIYDEFHLYEEGLKNISLYLGASLIGTIGILLAGMAIMMTVLSGDIKSTIIKVSGKEALESLLVSFEFIAFIIAVQVIEFFIVYLLLFSSEPLPSYVMFNFIVYVLVYQISFVLFYIIGLIGNCVKLFGIGSKIQEAYNKREQLMIQANEIRIDFVFDSILDRKQKDEFLENLIKYIKDSDIKNKEQLINYYKAIYKQTQ